MALVGDLLSSRHDLLTVEPGESVAVAIEKSTARDVSALPVLIEGRLAGIVTERDFVRRVLAHSADPAATMVKHVMTRKLITMHSGSDVELCMELMMEHRIRHMLVTDGAELVGILSIRDMVQQVLREKKFAISKMQEYISGSY